MRRIITSSSLVAIALLAACSKGPAEGTSGSSGPAADDPGRVTMHRLNRFEYNNTVRDLLGTALRGSEWLAQGRFGDDHSATRAMSALAIAMYLAVGAAAGLLAGLLGVGGGLIIVAALAFVLPAQGVPAFTLAEFSLPDRLPVSVPSEWARRRPDILAAEAGLRAAHAELGVTFARQYPQLNLSASLGSQALTTSALFGGAAGYYLDPALPVRIARGDTG